MTVRLSFHGADRAVTGSCHLLEADGCRILIDCGLFQGSRELAEENREELGFDPASVDYLLLTHAHLDHCGRIPLLIKQGFRGEIITTSATRDLCRLVLLDSAHLNEEEARRAERHGRGAGHNHAAMEPLFTTLDVLDTFDRFGRVARYAEPIRLGETVAATFCDAGHILGSASILVEVGKADRRRRIVFSGDLGSAGRALLPDPKPPSRVDVAVMETTYGDRKHRSFQASVDELHQAIAEALDRGGNVVIPTFALERAQEILFYFREGIEAGKLPRSLTVFLDSPMAISATEIFRRHPDFYRDDLRAMFARGKDPFDLPNLYFVREAADSIALNRIRSGAVILAGSGMCTGGRVRHHLRHNLSHADNSVIFVGFAAEGTLARIIIDGAKTVRLFGDEVPVRAKIHTINGFSAHGDQQDLRDWYDRLGDPQQTFLVHGEPDAMAAFARQLKSTQVHMPRLHEAFDL